jgi:hypothetical protein
MYVFDIRMQLAIVKWHFVFVMYVNNRITGAFPENVLAWDSRDFQG